jgi:hypothetical protein
MVMSQDDKIFSVVFICDHQHTFMCFKENEIYYQKQANLNQFDSFFKLQKAQ